MREAATITGGNVCSPAGFLAAGVAAGLKRSGRPDMALILSEKPCTAAGAFTQCRFAAAPVLLCRSALRKSVPARAVVINSGNANACTGAKGLKAAEEMASFTAKSLGISAAEVFVCSTGRIGVQLPMDKIRGGIAMAAKALSSNGGDDAAKAIMTTDTFEKKAAAKLRIAGKTVTIGGMAKGAGMIAPALSCKHATMICIVTTDAAVERKYLSKCLAEACELSFNRITVDGDTSTNDTVLLLANGAAGNRTICSDAAGGKQFRGALASLMAHLAKKIVLDGEGATKFVTVKVRNARSDKDAALCAKTIADSLLCKTAWFGGDPNWGRILAAAGRSGAIFNPGKVDLLFDKTFAVRKGMPTSVPEKTLAEIIRKPQFTVTVDLGAGKGQWEIWTNDISYEYVKINADYHT